MPGRPLTIAITGANSGIGLAAATRLADDGHQVYALCRSPERAEAALEQINRRAERPARLVVADLADQHSIHRAATELTERLDQLDVLVNNAAVFDHNIRQARFTENGHELFWATNHLGPFRLTAELSPLLAAAPRPRVLTVASKGLVTMPWIRIRFDELDDPGWYTPTRAYYHAKLAQVMTSFELALRAGGALDVSCVRVPAVRLDPARLAEQPRLLRWLYAPKNRAAVAPERLGETYAELATRTQAWTEQADADGDERARLRGIYLDEDRRPVTAPASAYDPAARERLWEVGQLATGNQPWAW